MPVSSVFNNIDEKKTCCFALKFTIINESEERENDERETQFMSLHCKRTIQFDIYCRSPVILNTNNSQFDYIIRVLKAVLFGRKSLFSERIERKILNSVLGSDIQ